MSSNYTCPARAHQEPEYCTESDMNRRVEALECTYMATMRDAAVERWSLLKIFSLDGPPGRSRRVRKSSRRKDSETATVDLSDLVTGTAQPPNGVRRCHQFLETENAASSDSPFEDRLYDPDRWCRGNIETIRLRMHLHASEFDAVPILGPNKERATSRSH